MVIPEGWKKYKISECAKIATGSKNTEDKCDDGRYPFFVRSQNIEHINTYNYDCEAVLTAGDGVGTGKVFHYINNHKFAVHQRVYVMSDFHNILGRYFYYYFSKNFYAEVVKYTAKSSVDSVRRKMIADMALIIPESEFEQTAIATALSDMDDLIASLEKLLAKKQGIKQGAMQDLLTGRKRLKGFSGKWKRIQLGDSEYTMVDYANIAANVSANYKFDYITLENVKNGKIMQKIQCIYATAPSRARRIVHTGDVLFGTVRPNLHSHVYVDFLTKDVICSTGFCVIHGIAKKLDSRFIYYKLLSFECDTQIQSIISGSSYPAVSSDDVKSLEIFIPEIQEQRAIATLLSDMDAEITALQQKLAKYRQIKQGMMAELLTGRIRLKEA